MDLEQFTVEISNLCSEICERGENVSCITLESLIERTEEAIKILDYLRAEGI